MKSMTGQTFLDYLKKYRLYKAAALLKKGDVQVTEVCFAVGFNHRSYFAKAFKEEFGKSPKTFANDL
jgi:AraC-like DNA-binding protein